VTTRSKLNAEELAAWGGFLRTHARLVRELDDELQAAHDLPLAFYDVLVNLDRAPGRRLRMRDLADAVILSRSGLTRLVDRMTRQGLIERARCREDARGFFAVLTDAGAGALREARPTHLDGVRRRFLNPLQTADLGTLAGAWDRILDDENLTDSD
jgi:DNA-binding MarR family transcriptional regulator